MADKTMYFLWQRTPRGSIRVSLDGLMSFIGNRTGLRPHSLALSACSESGGNALMTVVLPDDEGTSRGGGDPDSPVADLKDRDASASDLSALMAPMGIDTSVVVADRGSPAAQWLETRCSVLAASVGNPWAWMAGSSSAALIVLAGVGALFWTLFWGTVAWFAVRLFAQGGLNRLFVMFGDGRR